jgi:hypothetical protein
LVDRGIRRHCSSHLLGDPPLLAGSFANDLGGAPQLLGCCSSLFGSNAQILRSDANAFCMDAPLLSVPSTAFCGFPIVFRITSIGIDRLPNLIIYDALLLPARFRIHAFGFGVTGSSWTGHHASWAENRKIRRLPRRSQRADASR